MAKHANVNVRPSRLERIAFRAIGWKLGPQHHDWIVEDVRSRRTLRWRGATAGMVAVITHIGVRLAIMHRSGDELVVAALISGVSMFGVAAVLLFASSRWQAARGMDAALRGQGLEPDGRPAPFPRGSGRLSNYDIAAIQMLLVAFLGVALGLLPRWLEPVPTGRCLTPSAASATPLRDALRPGVSIEHLRIFKGEYATAYSGVVRVDRGADSAAVAPDGVIASWLVAHDAPPFPMDEAAMSTTPSLGRATSINDPAPLPERSAECARGAAANGKGRTISAPRVSATGPLRLTGALDGTFDGITGVCTPASGASATFASADGARLVVAVRPPYVDITVRPADVAAATETFHGRVGDVGTDIVRINAAMTSERSRLRTLQVVGEFPCSPTGNATIDATG